MVNRILILGAGFAGLRIAQDLAHLHLPADYSITLVDRSDVHIFTPDLYEVATAFNEKLDHGSLIALKQTIATPIMDLISPGVDFLHDEVVDIQPNSSTVHFKHSKPIRYSILVIALGSVTHFYGVPGLKKYAFPLKTLSDALRINGHLDRLFQEFSKAKTHRPLNITVGGGGATGVEVAGELSGALNRLCDKYDYPRKQVALRIVEGTPFLGTFNHTGTKIIQKRFLKRGIELHLSTFVAKLTKQKLFIRTSDGKTQSLPSDIFIWTGGVQVNSIVAKTLGSSECHGAIPVESSLLSKGHSRIFAAGDNAFFPDPQHTDRPLPMLAQLAYAEGALIAKNIHRLLYSKPLLSYHPHPHALILPLGGRYSICHIRSVFFKGFFCWILKRFISLRYALSILPFWKALVQWQHGNRIFMRND